MREQDVSHWNRILDIQDRGERRAEKALHHCSHLRVPSFMDVDYRGEVCHLFRKEDVAARERRCGPTLLEPFNASLFHWLYVPSPYRSATGKLIIWAFEVCVVCDACLVFIPLHMLRSLRLPKTDRYLIRLVFGASILSSIAIVVDTTCVMTYFPKTSSLATIELTAQLKVSALIRVINNQSLLLTIDSGRSSTTSVQPDRCDTLHLSPLQK